jgi:hypothetical protein
MILASLYFPNWLFWAVVSYEVLLAVPLCFANALTAFISFRVSALKSGFPNHNFAYIYSDLVRTIHNSSPLRDFPHFSRSAPGNNLIFIEYFIYLLYYRPGFWVFVRDGMTLRIQRCQILCPLFLEFRYRVVRHFWCTFKFTVCLFS